MTSNHRAPFSRSGGVGSGLVQTLHPSSRFPMQCFASSACESYIMVTMDALLAGVGSTEFPSTRATVLRPSLDTFRSLRTAAIR